MTARWVVFDDRQMGHFRRPPNGSFSVVVDKEYLAYDITSVSSYSELNDMTRYGYNRDGESLPQVNIAMLFGENLGYLFTLNVFQEALKM